MFAIEKGIPVPASRKFGENASKYPWRAMSEGDSFAVPLNGDRKTQARVSVSARKAGKCLNRKFVTRRTGEVVRVWRVA